MQVKVLLHGFLKTLAPAEELVLELEGERLRVEDVLAAAASRLGTTGERLRFTAVAIGDELVPRSHPVEAGATVALLPPVSGG